MPHFTKPHRDEVRIASPQVSITVNATPVTLYNLNTADGKTCILRKLTLANKGNNASTYVQVGEQVSASFTPRFASFYLISGQDLRLTEDELPNWEFTGTVQIQAVTAGVAPNNIEASCEVGELEGSTAHA